MTRDLIIINGRCFEITNLGWNPKQLNPQLKAMCAPCHLRYDAKHHAESRLAKREQEQNHD